MRKEVRVAKLLKSLINYYKYSLQQFYFKINGRHNMTVTTTILLFKLEEIYESMDEGTFKRP